MGYADPLPLCMSRVSSIPAIYRGAQGLVSSQRTACYRSESLGALEAAGGMVKAGKKLWGMRHGPGPPRGYSPMLLLTLTLDAGLDRLRALHR